MVRVRKKATFTLKLCDSKVGPSASSNRVSWELVGNVDSQAPTQPTRIRLCSLTRVSSDYITSWNLKRTAYDRRGEFAKGNNLVSNLFALLQTFNMLLHQMGCKLNHIQRTSTLVNLCSSDGVFHKCSWVVLYTQT